MKNILIILSILLSTQIFAQSVDLNDSSFKWIGKKVTGQHFGKIKLNLHILLEYKKVL